MKRRPRHHESGFAAEALEPDTVYSGAAVLTAGEITLDVVVHLNGHFEPLDGHFHWYGRLDGPGLAGLTGPDRARSALSIGAGEPRPATLGEQDPWGHLRISGTGAPPFPLDEIELDVPIP